MAGITEGEVRQIVEELAPAGSTRAIGTAFGNQMVDWVGQKFASWGLEVEKQPVESEESGENIIGIIPGSSSDAAPIVVGGHIDSVQAGPGANDDASGVAATMVAAHALSTLPRNCFKSPVHFVGWNGEEETMGGSRAYAEKYKVKAGLVMDMIATPGGVNANYMTEYNQSQALAERFMATVQKYNITGTKFAAREEEEEDGTDASSLWAEGLPAIEIIEDGRDPDYHRASDTPANFGDWTQDANTAKVVAAMAAELAGEQPTPREQTPFYCLSRG